MTRLGKQARLVALFVLLCTLVPAVARTSAGKADAADGPAPACVTGLNTPAVLVDATSGDRMAPSEWRTVSLPEGLGPAVAALVQVTVDSGGTATAVRVAVPEAGAVRDEHEIAHAAAYRPGASTALVAVKDGDFLLQVTPVPARVRVRLLGVVSEATCFTAAPRLTLLDVPEGAPLSTGSEVRVDLVGSGFLSVPDVTSVVGVSLAAASDDAVVELSIPGGPSLGMRKVPRGTTVDLTEVVPANGTGALVVRAVTGPVAMRIVGIGWFADATSFNAERAHLGGSPALPNPLSDETTLALPISAAGAETVLLHIRVDPTVATGGQVTVWPAGSSAPAEPTVSSASRFRGTEQVVAVRPGESGQVVVRASVGTQWSVDFVGWSSRPPVVNAPSIVTTVAEPDQVSVLAEPTPEAPDSSTVLSYTGPKDLTPGDILVVPDSEELPNGILVKVRSEAPADPANPSQQVVEVEPASILDAIPTGEWDEEVPVESDEPSPPDDAPPAPGDEPPGADSGSASGPSTSIGPPAVGNPFAMPRAGVGGRLPDKASFSCSGGVRADITTPVRLYGNVNLSAQWQWRRGVSANFGFDGGISGQVRAFVSGKASCNGSVTLGGPRLPTIRFMVGAVPVVVVPELTFNVRFTAELEAGISASAGIDVGVSAGVNYADGRFSPYFTPRLSFPTGIDAKAGGRAEIEVGPRLAFKVYNAAGPYVDVVGFANASIDASSNPWWKVDAGVRAGVGFKLNVWLVKGDYQAPRRELTRRRVSEAPTSYPGPTISGGALPSGQVGSRYDRAIPISGGRSPFRFYRLSGSPPPGLTLREDGRVIGTPTQTGTWSLRVRALDAGGYRSKNDADVSITIGSQPPPTTTTTSAPTTTTTPPPAQGPSVSISKGGSAVGQSGCSHSSCRWIDVSVSRFSPNASVTIVCRATGDEGGFWTYTRRTDGNGNGFFTGCYYGFPGRQVWVTVNGVESNRITW